MSTDPFQNLVSSCKNKDNLTVEVYSRKYVAKHAADLRGWAHLLQVLLSAGNGKELRLLVGRMLAIHENNTHATILGVKCLAYAGFVEEAYGLSMGLSEGAIQADRSLAKAVNCLGLLLEPDTREVGGAESFDEIEKRMLKFNLEARKMKRDEPVRVVCYLRHKWHYHIQCSIADALTRMNIPVYYSDSIWFAVASRPDVLVISEALCDDLAKIRYMLPNCVIVNTRHGLGDKNHAALGGSHSDYVCVSSESVARLLERDDMILREKIWVTGFPQMDSLFRGLCEGANSQRTGKTVLFAPTCTPELSAAFLLEDDLVQKIRGNDTDVRIIIRPHPHLARTLPSIVKKWLFESHQNVNVEIRAEENINIVDLYLESDLMISDVSSAALSWLATDKPLICVVDREKAEKSWHYAPDGLEWKMHDASILVENIDELPPSVCKALRNPSLLAEKRRPYRDYLFGNLQDGVAGQRIADRIHQLLNTG